jgi:hypothetical protein
VPFLRVIRDKRGYETTYLMHWFREGSRQRSRILYVFRTPGGVRGGRAPHEPAVHPPIEAQKPHNIEFDWSVIRDNQQVVEPLIDQRRRRPRRDEVAPASTTEPVEVPPPAPAAAPEPRPPGIPAAIQGTTPDEQITFLTRHGARRCSRCASG